MSAMNYQATKNYQKVQVESASPEKLVLMLFDGAVKKLGFAEAAFESKMFDDFHEHVVRVQKIITELLGALDTSKGGELAENLERLYDYMLRQLSLALVRKNLDQVQEVKTLLEELRLGWQGVVQQGLGDGAKETAGVPDASTSTKKTEAQGYSYSSNAQPVSSLNISG